MKNNKDSFWITNISKKAIHLGDLAVIIYPMRSLNLLSKNHNLTIDQLEKSKTSGSLFAKRNAVVVREVPPEKEQQIRIDVKEDATYPSKHRSVVEIENIKYEELAVDDDTYAAENADTAQIDHLGKWNKG